MILCYDEFNLKLQNHNFKYAVAVCSWANLYFLYCEIFLSIIMQYIFKFDGQLVTTHNR